MEMIDYEFMSVVIRGPETKVSLPKGVIVLGMVHLPADPEQEGEALRAGLSITYLSPVEKGKEAT